MLCGLRSFRIDLFGIRDVVSLAATANLVFVLNTLEPASPSVLVIKDGNIRMCEMFIVIMQNTQNPER